MLKSNVNITFVMTKYKMFFGRGDLSCTCEPDTDKTEHGFVSIMTLSETFSKCPQK